VSKPVAATPALLADWPLPRVRADSDKEDRGRVLVMAAGAEVAGATLLTAQAALRAGAGKLQICAPRSLAVPLALALPEARVIPAPETAAGELAPQAASGLGEALQRCDVAVAGPGMLDEEAAGEIALRLADRERTALVIDAAALVGLARDPARAARHLGGLVLTPHMGEMAALLGCADTKVQADPLAAARAAAQRFQAVVALKGHETVIATPQGETWRHVGQAAGLATSGSGDVLAGLIAGLIARGASPAQAAVWGVFVHGQAGERLAERVGRLGYLARELLDEIAPALNGLEAAGEA